MVESNGGEVFDVGGLRGTGAGTAALAGRIWRDLDSDAIHFTDDATFTTRVRNAVRLDGAIQAPDAFAADLLEGFDATYRLLLAHREALLAADGPLAAFAGTPVRVLPRPTTQYASLIYLLSRPTLSEGRLPLEHGVRRAEPGGQRIARRARGLAGPGQRAQGARRPRRPALHRARRRHRRPRRPARADRAALCPIRAGRREGSRRRPVAGRPPGAARRGSAARCRRRSTAAIRPSPSTPRTPSSTSPRPTSSSTTRCGSRASWSTAASTPRTVIGYAGWALMDETGPRRHHLYDGSLGPAVFLAAAAVVSGEDRWRRCARDFAGGASAAVAKGVVDDAAIGVGSGAASVVYGLTTIGALLGDGTSLELARSAARQIAPHRIARDTALDVISGAAGAALGLLALYKVTHDSDILDLATACGDRLLQTAMEADQGLSWRAPDGRVYTGFAHGVAGIAYALGRLFDVTGERRFGRASADGYRYVASRYVDAAQNWPVLGEPVEGVAGLGPSMTAWCHGAPGVTLAISLGSADTVYAKLLDQLEPVAQDHRRRLAAHGRSPVLRQHGALRIAVHDRPAPDAARGRRRLAPAGAGRHRPGPQGRPLLPGRQRVRIPYLRPRASSGACRGSAIPCCAWRRHPACRPSPPSKRRPPACGPRDPLWLRSTTFMRRSAVLSLALLVALPAWAAAQVITLPSEPGFGFKDTPPTVPASRLIPQAMADAARLSDFRATVDLTRAFVDRHRPVPRAGAAERRHRPADHDLPAVDVVGRSSRRHQGDHRPGRRDRRSPSAPPRSARACSRSASASSRSTTIGSTASTSRTAT